MGYIGLLLNAPYKIDSMVWMRLMMIVFVFLVLFLLIGFVWAIRTKGIKWG
jgi:hypothetical protein